MAGKFVAARVGERKLYTVAGRARPAGVDTDAQRVERECGKHQTTDTKNTGIGQSEDRCGDVGFVRGEWSEFDRVADP